MKQSSPQTAAPSGKFLLNPSRYWPLVLVALAPLLLGLLLFVKLREIEQQQLASAFRSAAENRFALIQREHERQAERLEALAAYYATAPVLTRDGFRTFVQRFVPAQSPPVAVEWVPRVSAARRAEHEAALRAQGHPEYRITEPGPDGQWGPAGEREEYFPVAFSEGRPGLLLTEPGQDLGALSSLRGALLRARDSGNLAVSPIYLLHSTEGSLYGFFVAFPVYLGGHDPGSVESRRWHLEGFFLAIFPLGQIINDALTFADPLGVDIHVFDITQPEVPVLLHHRPTRAWRAPPPPVHDPALLHKGLHAQMSMPLGDRRITLFATATPAFYELRHTYFPWLALASGMFLSLLLATTLAVQRGRVLRAREQARSQAEARERLEREVAERRRAETRLAAANRELEAFVYTLSHDLRTPLTVMTGYAELVQMNEGEQLAPESRKALQDIHLTGHRMAALMDDLLALARVGQVPVPSEPVASAEVVSQVLENRAIELAGEGLRVETGDLPVARFPESLLFQLFDNLIGNAIRYAGSAGGPIEIAGEREGNRVRLRVRDHGPGVPAAERERIFELFARGSSGEKVLGTGVGLATVRKIAGLYGGEVRVEETPGGGATFVVELVEPPVDPGREGAGG